MFSLKTHQRSIWLKNMKTIMWSYLPRPKFESNSNYGAYYHNFRVGGQQLKNIREQKKSTWWLLHNLTCMMKRMRKMNSTWCTGKGRWSSDSTKTLSYCNKKRRTQHCCKSCWYPASRRQQPSRGFWCTTTTMIISRNTAANVPNVLLVLLIRWQEC